MSEAIKKLQERIEIDREAVGLLPRNNLKNITKTLEKIDEIKEKYISMYEDILKEIETRFKKINQAEENQEIGRRKTSAF